MRLDAVARFLQDIATDDGADAALPRSGYWVLRTMWCEIDGEPPRFGDRVDLATWCSGTGPRWAERRTDIAVDGSVRVRSAAIWVYVDRVTGRPAALPDDFDRVYGPSALGREIRARLAHPGPPEGVTRVEWPLRAIDFDMLGHVNNAAYWGPIEELLARADARSAVRDVAMEIRGGIDAGERVMLTHASNAGRLRAWLLVDEEVRASAELTFVP